MKKILFIFVILCSALFAFAQDNPVNIPKGSRVKVLWTAPPDTDVVKYRLYWTQEAVDSLDFQNWYIANDTTSQCNVVLTVPLKLGSGFIQLSAIDLAGNKSDRSNSAYFYVYDPPPGKPYIIEILVP